MSSQSSQSCVVLQGLGSCNEPAFTDHYMVLQDTGKGGFTQVKLARHLLTGTEVAVKVLAKVASNFPLFSEPEMMAALDHRNVIQLFQVIETFDNFYIIVEHAGGERLWDVIPHDGMQEEEAHRLFRQIVHAMQYCHKQGIVHLDLKPENIMVDASGNVKLIDFGLSTRYTAGEKLKRIWGTCPYFAPELTQGKEYEGPPADVWSLGVILYFMLTGSCPFRASSRKQLKKLIKQGTYDIPLHVSEGAQSLINEILMVDPTQRPTIEQVMGHPWLSQGGEAASSSPSSEALPKLPDPTIMKTMIDMGYHPCNTWVSVASRRFNDTAMATYLILKHQRTQRLGLADPSRVCPKKCSSEPTLPLPGEQQQPEEAKQSQQKGAASASLPALHLQFLHVDTAPPSLASQHDPVPSSSSSPGTSTGPSHHSSRGWKRVKKRIAKCMQQLCCIPCFHPTASRDRVAPVEMPSPDRQN